MLKMVSMIIGLVLTIGGICTIYANHKYFGVIRKKGTENAWSPIAVYYGYYIGGMFVFFGICFFFGLMG